MKLRNILRKSDPWAGQKCSNPKCLISFVQIPTIKHSDLPDETLSTSQGVLHVKLTMTKMEELRMIFRTKILLRKMMMKEHISGKVT